jgi:hypothetical protein
MIFKDNILLYFFCANKNESGDFIPIDFSEFELAYKSLTEKLQPQVFELAFLCS